MTGNKPSNVPLHNEQRNEQIDKWFSDFIDHLQVDHFLLKQDIASKETTDFYDAIFSGNETSVLSQVRETSSKFFIQNLIVDYINELRTFKKVPLKLALGLSDSKILVWSEINDDDEATEDALLLAEARVNSKYHPFGFYINSTIIEKSDNISVPPHYQNILVQSPK